MSFQGLQVVYGGEDIESSIRDLSKRELLDVDSDGISMHPIIREYLYDSLKQKEEKRIDLHIRAAKYFEEAQNTLTQANFENYTEAYWHSYQAEDYDRAYEVIFKNHLNDYLRRWGYSPLLVDIYQKLAIRNNRTVQILSDRRKHCNVLREFGKTYSDLSMPAQAIEHLNQSLEISQEIEDCRIQYEALGNLGTVYSNLGYLDKSIYYYSAGIEVIRKCVEIAETSEGRETESLWLGYLGLGYAYKGELQKAEKNCRKALEISQDSGSKNRNLCSLGFVHFQRHELCEAISHFQRAVSVSKKAKDKRGEGRALGYLGRAYLAGDKLDEAFQALREAVEIAHDVGDYRREGIWKGYLGGVYLKKSEIDSALEYLKESLKISNTVGNQSYETEQLNYLGMVCKEKKWYEKSLACYLMARCFWERSGVYGIIEHIETNIKDLETTVGDRKFNELVENVQSREGKIIRGFVPELPEDWYRPPLEIQPDDTR